jgi:hypothetical protein
VCEIECVIVCNRGPRDQEGTVHPCCNFIPSKKFNERSDSVELYFLVNLRC